MAACMPSGSAAREGGFTYLGVLLLVMLMGVALGSAGEVWSIVAQRERERQLLWVGTQYAQALRSYYRASPGLAQYPKALEDLLQDDRFPSARHHIRQLYPDPLGAGEWTLQRGFDGRITGIASASTETPLKQADFPVQWSDFNGLGRYSDWQFVAEKAFLEGASARGKGPQAASGPGPRP
ncbi:type II secretion system protein [Pseudomonas sp. zfem002]|uniref:type II secretion system protein n=1 Tax=Pseudomonas sp. zfem002 TaxID=3078197 RepID=UPI002929EC2C|nr:type II secretion system protein [Pseudomonas sp. zfem002]MDU9392063.1 type II secretion system protein [Pseudomonas sp. zfem002]